MNYPQPGYPAPQYPQAPPAQPQPYAQPQGYPAYPQQPAQNVGYPPPMAPPQAPAIPLANGTLDDFYNQPSGGTGPAISWKGKPEGTTYVGIVARDVTNADIQQDSDPMTKQPKFFRDGRPQFVMKVPLKVAPSQEFPDGECTWFVRGQARDELSRAMAEAGVQGAPKGGAGVRVTLVQRKPSRAGGNPANIVQVAYQPGAGQTGGQAAASGAPIPAPSPAPEVQPQAPVQQAPQPQAPQPQWAPQEQPQQFAPQAPAAPAAPAPVAPAPAPQGGPQPPADLSPDQQALLARLTGGQG